MNTHRHLLPALCSLLGLCMGFAATEAVQAQNAPVNRTDSLALVALFDSTGGPNWIHKDRWLTGRASTWEGVDTELRGAVRRVTRLTFLNNNLVGKLPEDLKDLDELTSLLLTGNMLSGRIPPYLGELTNLTILALNGNQFDGPIPDLSTLVKLTTLFLQDNKLTGSIPPELGKMASLESLYLGENQLTESIPQELDGLLNLRHLRLQTNKLMGAVPQFTNLPSLESLFLDFNQLEDLPKLTGLPNSVALSVQGNRLTFEDLEPNVGLFASFDYLLQESVETQVDEATGTVSVEVGGLQTTYQWYKDLVPIPSSDAMDRTYTVTEDGAYLCRTENPLLPGLVIWSRSVNVGGSMSDIIVNSVGDAPDANVNDGTCNTGGTIDRNGAEEPECTLRGAIETVNHPQGGKTDAAARILFDIPMAGIPTIQPAAALPEVIQPVEIDGTTQGTDKLVKLDGSSAGGTTDGLVIGGGGSTIKGLAIIRFTGSGLVLRNEGGNVVEGTYLGTDNTALDDAGNGVHGIWIDDVPDNRIGGEDANASNVVASNGVHGILIAGTQAINNKLWGNAIGVHGAVALGNGEDGVHLRDASDNEIGGEQEEHSNIIRNNGEVGVSVVGTGIDNTIRKNEIFGNGGLGIDLGGDGVTANDLGDGRPANMDTDTGPNELINFPMGVTALPSLANPGQVVITGITEPASLLAAVDIYMSSARDEAGFGEGEKHVATVQPDANGLFKITVARSELTMPFLSATVTSFNGSTSEFSAVCGDTTGDGNSDTDGDALCDDWEANGIDYDGDGTVDLALNHAPFNADPSKKDLFVEIDYMQGHREKPIGGALNEVMAAFDRQKINLHLMEDEEVPHFLQLAFVLVNSGLRDFDDLKLGAPYDPCGTGDNDGHFGTKAERGQANCAAILGARRLVFRYAIFGHSFELHPPSGVAEQGGNDLMLSLGGWTEDEIRKAGGSPNAEIALQRFQAATLMHELGHTLNLRHGGKDDINCKPNYPSIMSYGLQTGAAIPVRVLDYSGQALHTLNEAGRLDEPAGLNGPPNRKVLYSRKDGSIRSVSTNQRNIDWDGIDEDGDGIFNNDRNAASDINNILSEGCSGEGEELVSHNDWAVLRYNFRESKYFGNAVSRQPTNAPGMTKEMVAELAHTIDYDGDGFFNADDNCPAYANADQTDTNGDGVGDMCEQPVAELILTMTASAEEVRPGLPLTYTMAVYNVGPDTTTVTLVDTLDARLTFVSATTSRGTCTENQGVVQCDLGEMVYDDSLGVRLVVQSSTEAMVENTATVSSPFFDPDTTNNQVTVTTAIAVAVENGVELPSDYQLEQNYPNPFNPVTTIRYVLPVPERVRLVVYDVLGREVAVLVDGVKATGRHEAHFDAIGLSGGVYVYRLTAGRFTETRKMILLK